jgi:hypothetical protein
MPEEKKTQPPFFVTMKKYDIEAPLEYTNVSSIGVTSDGKLLCISVAGKNLVLHVDDVEWYEWGEQKTIIQ